MEGKINDVIMKRMEKNVLTICPLEIEIRLFHGS
jgi:hypothetical protein